MQKLFCAVLSLLFLSTAKAQQPLQFSFVHYNTANGLLSNQLNTIVQDADGYLWTGTTDGLQRFDGIRYRSFKHRENEPGSIPSNPVWQLLIDKNNHLWVLLANGTVGIFDTRTFSFREITAIFKKPVSPNTFIKRLIADEYGNVFYLMGGSEVITWSETAGNFSYANNFFPEMENREIADFIQEPGTQKYWISIEQQGLAVFDKTTAILSYPGNNISGEKLVDLKTGGQTLYHLFFDRQHRLWACTQSAFPMISCYDRSSGKPLVENAEFNSYLKSQYEVKGFFQQKDGTLWVNGLMVFARYHENEKKFQPVYNGYQNDKSISYEMIHCLYEDSENNLWIGTDNNGIYRFNPATEFFINVRHNSHTTGNRGEADLLSFIPTQWGTTLAGTEGDGLYQYDQNFNEIPLHIKGLNERDAPVAWSMSLSRDSQTIWIGSQEGIYSIDQKKRAANFYRPASLKNKAIRQIKEDKNGSLWLGTSNSGIFKYPSGPKGKNMHLDPVAVKTIPPVPINHITVDSKGDLWISTPETGVFVLDPVTERVKMHFTDHSEVYQLPEAGVSCVLEYDDSTMIIATANRIVRYNRNSNKTRTVGSSETISGFIAAMEKDENGYLWLTSSNGLYRINLQKNIFIYYNRIDGIDNDHFKQSASRSLPGGFKVFGSTNHFVAFDPLHMQVKPVSPHIRITDFKVSNKSLPVDSLTGLKEIELGYQDNSLNIEFSPLVYSYPYLIKYKMEGIDKVWRTSDKNYQAVYSYLPPGQYVFKLMAMDEEGNESANITSLKIQIAAPFWKTTWFYCLLILTVGGLLYWLDRERMKRKESIHKMRNDIADNLHQEVNVALSNINILSEMANLKVGTEPEKSKEYIEQIHFRSNHIITAMDDMLWSIKPENDNMSRAIERISEHVDALRHRFDVKIRLLVDAKVETLKLDMKLRKDIFWLFKGGITNIVRSGATDCSLHISVYRQKLTYTVEFDKTHLNLQQMNNLLQREELAKKLSEVNGSINAQLHKTRSEIELTIQLA